MPGINVFAGVGAAKTYEQGNYFKPGKYRLSVKKMLLKQSQKSGMVFIVEFTVLQTSNPKDHPVGSSGSWVQKLSDQTVAFPALKDFMLKLLQIDQNDSEQLEQFESEIDTTLEEATSGEGNTFAEAEIGVECTMIKTQKRQVDFTRHRWIPANDPESFIAG